MKILVTGSQGTLGTPLVKELRKRGHKVHCCDIQHENEDNYYRCDIAEYRQLYNVINLNKFDLIYNLAAEFGRINGEMYYEQVWKTNVIGFRNILELQRIFGFKLIHASSSEIYGELDNYVYHELDSPAPQGNDYAISKWVNELQCKNFITKYKAEIMIPRFFNAYGPGEYYNDFRSVVCLFCYRALFDIPYTVYQNYYRVFMYIDDFIPTLANCCEKFEAGMIVNIGGKEYRSVKELSNIILTQLNKDDKLVTYMEEDVHNIKSKRPDIKLASFHLNHSPSITLEEGIKKTLDWMKGVYL